MTFKQLEKLYFAHIHERVARRENQWRKELLQHVAAFGQAVLNSTKRQITGASSKLATKQERKRAIELLEGIGVTNPTDAEIDSCIPG